MPKSRIAALALLIASAGALATVAVAPAASAATTGRAPVRVHATHAHSVVTPRSTHPGIAKLHNSGRGLLLVVTPRHHHSTSDLSRDLNLAIGKNKPARLIHDFSIVGGLFPHKNLFTRLYRGHVFLADVSAKTFSPASIGRIRVSGARRDVALSASTLALDSSNALSAPQSVVRHGLLRFVNDSRTPDLMMMIRIGDHVAESDVAAFVAHPTDAGLNGLQPRGAHVLGLSLPSQASWAEYRLYPGRYLAVAADLASDNEDLFRSGGVREVVVG